MRKVFCRKKKKATEEKRKRKKKKKRKEEEERRKEKKEGRTRGLKIQQAVLVNRQEKRVSGF